MRNLYVRTLYGRISHVRTLNFQISYVLTMMLASFSTIWSTATQLGLPGLSVADWALLLLLGASVLAARAVRELYLKIWIAGWTVFLASRLAEHAFAARFPAPFGLVTVQAAFVLAVGLLAGAVLLYARNGELIGPLAVITPILVGFAGARVLLWPDSLPLRVAVEVGYRIILLTAAVALFRARRGRWEISSWLLALCLPTLHLSWTLFTHRIPDAAFLAAEIALGLSMLLVAFKQAHLRTRRLQTVEALTQSMSGAQPYGNLIQAALEELRRFQGVRGAWFRVLENGQLVATHAVGMSTEFQRNASPAAITEDLTKLLESAVPLVAQPDATAPEDSTLLEAE